jgi:hypothetical protein
MESKEDLTERKKMAWDALFYSVQRMDLLIITISGAGLYVILETLKYSMDKPLCCLWVIKASGAIFVSAIIVNFISQHTGKKCNHHDMLWCEEKIYFDNPPTAAQLQKAQNHDTHAEIYSTVTKWFNLGSMILMFIALISLVLYFLIIF